MGDQGVFDGTRRVELIGGEIVDVSPQNHPHAALIRKLTHLLVARYGDTHYVMVQLPLTLNPNSEPEPDFSLVPHAEADQAVRHPTRADAVLEISDSTLTFDRLEKGSLYASAGIPLYAILNLRHRRVEIRTAPAPDPDAPFGCTYIDVQVFAPGQQVELLGYTWPVDSLLGPE